MAVETRGRMLQAEGTACVRKTRHVIDQLYVESVSWSQGPCSRNGERGRGHDCPAIFQNRGPWLGSDCQGLFAAPAEDLEFFSPAEGGSRERWKRRNVRILGEWTSGR